MTTPPLDVFPVIAQNIAAGSRLASLGRYSFTEDFPVHIVTRVGTLPGAVPADGPSVWVFVECPELGTKVRFQVKADPRATIYG